MNYSNLWTDSNQQFRPTFCINDEWQIPRSPGYVPCLMFQDTPHPTSSCDNARAQTPHAGVMNVTLADGSVRGVSPAMDSLTWAYACDPRDGQALPADWGQ
jgi:prepilin-type processing-associated H-X9-DG protein